MNYKKENLDILLNFIKEIANEPGNDSFRNNLISIITESARINHLSSDASIEKQLNKIETYLAINFENLIDYSGFKSQVKDQLLRDCIEMCRYQSGTQNHKKNFGEYCRYAHLQAEEMVNYFLITKCNNKIEYIYNYIIKYNSEYRHDKKPENVHQISYVSKIYALKTSLPLASNTFSWLWFLHDFRNDLSHRNSLNVRNTDQYLILYEQAGYLSKYVEFDKLTKEEKKTYNNGLRVIRERKEEYMSVYNIIVDLKDTILKSLNHETEVIPAQGSIGESNPFLQELKKQLVKDKAK